MADAADSKSAGNCSRVGSNPTTGILLMNLKLPLKILIGPIFNPGVLGQYIHAEDILCFASEHYIDKIPQAEILYNPTKDFQDILNQMPTNWQPDVVIWWDLIYQSIPTGIVDCPYPSAVIIGDWNLGFLTTLNYVGAFDYILTDRHLHQLLQSQGYSHSYFWPGFSFEPDKHYKMPEVEKTIDIAFIGNLDHNVQRQRGAYLERIARLGQTYKVFIGGGIYGEDYTQLLNQSKIVFNHSIRKEMNMRAYEAPACNALLFMEESNLEIQDFLPPDEACILYNTENLEDLLNHYLSHEDERARIANNAYEIIQNYSYEKQFKSLIELLKTLLQEKKPSQQRAFSQFTELEQQLIIARQIYCARYSSKARALELLSDPQIVNSDIANLYKADYKHLNALGCFMLNSLLELSNPTPPHPALNPAEKKLLENLITLFQVSLKLKSEQAFTNYHLGLAFELNNELQQAEFHYTQSLHQLNHLSSELDIEAMYVLPFDFSPFAVEWQRASFHERLDLKKHRKNYQSLMTYHLGQKLGFIFSINGQSEQAISILEKALKAFTDIDKAGILLYQLYLHNAQTAKANKTLKTIIKERPFAIDLWLKLLKNLYHQEDFEEVLEFCNKNIPLLFANKSLKGDLQKFEHYEKLAQLALKLKNDTDINFKSILSGQITLELYQEVKELFHKFQQDSILIQPFHFNWRASCPEMLPEIDPQYDMIYKTQPESDTVPIGTTYTRNYHGSSIKPQDLNVSDFPPFFYRGPYPMSLDVEEWNDFNLLFICENINDKGIIEALRLYLHHFKADSSITCHLWFPNAEPTDEELENLAESIDIESQAIVSLLMDSLSVEEQCWLLKHSDCMMGFSHSISDFFLWWGIYLFTPTIFLSEPPNNFSNIDLIVTQPENLQNQFKQFFEKQWKEQAIISSEQFQDYYQLNAIQMFINTLWSLKLAQL